MGQSLMVHMHLPWTLAAWCISRNRGPGQEGLAQGGRRLSSWRTEQVCMAGKDRSDHFSIGDFNADASGSCKKHLSPAVHTQDQFVCC